MAESKMSRVSGLEFSPSTVEATNSYTASLPILENTNDSMHVKMHFKGTGASQQLTIGGTAITTGTLTIDAAQWCIWDFFIFNQGSGNFLVMGNVVETGSTQVDSASFAQVITESIGSTNVTISVSNTHTSDRWIVVT